MLLVQFYFGPIEWNWGRGKNTSDQEAFVSYYFCSLKTEELKVFSIRKRLCKNKTKMISTTTVEFTQHYIKTHLLPIFFCQIYYARSRLSLKSVVIKIKNLPSKRLYMLVTLALMNFELTQFANEEISKLLS